MFGAIVAEEAARRGARRVGVLGTRYTMAGPVYRNALGAAGLEALVPESPDFERIDGVIFDELVNGVIREESRLAYNDAIRRLAARGCDAVALACTEIPLLVRADDCPLPVLDSTRLLARAALLAALE